MSKTIGLDDDVYAALKARASKEGRTLGAAVYALTHTADEQTSTEKRIKSLKNRIADLKSFIFFTCVSFPSASKNM
jgi:macrodomain Ter protein organizer (MatP/YcbG family)